MKIIIFLSAISGFLAVALGAFGSHALKNRLDEYSQGVWNTANDYHFYHSLAALLIGLLLMHFPNINLWRYSGFLMLIGVTIFSGSLYLLALTGIKSLGALTPMGGLCWLAAWALLALGALSLKS